MPTNHSDSVVNEIPTWIASQCSMLAVALLRTGAMRFSELHRSMDIDSRQNLVLTLRQLERNGLVSRAPVSGRPHATYELTSLGASLPARISALEEWVARHRDALRLARERYDEAQVVAS